MHNHFRIFYFLLFFASLTSCGGGGGGGGDNQNSSYSVPSSSSLSSFFSSSSAHANLTRIHNFLPAQGDGGQPDAPLLQASDGNLYGTTLAGGLVGGGVIFKIAPDGTESIIHHFGYEDFPSGPLIQGLDGALYGETSGLGGGSVYKITLDGVYTALYLFGGVPDDGLSPTGGLVQAADGDFYGVTASGGANHCFQIPQEGGNCGTIFKMTPEGKMTILHSFGNFDSDGVEPVASLVQASDGNFYGTTANGGENACTTVYATNNCGTLFRMTPSGETTILHSFGPSWGDPIASWSALIQGADGALYGTTLAGGGGGFCPQLFSCGTVFRFTLAGELSIVHAFANDSIEDGFGPSQLSLGRDGNFYGTTNAGGINDHGTAFAITPTGVLTTLYSFGPFPTAISNPVGGLIQGGDGAFYGVTRESGDGGGMGTVFKLVRNR